MLSRSVQSLLVVIASVIALSSSHAQSRHEMTEVHMGMRVRLVMYGDEAHAVRAARAAFDRIARLDDKMSDYRPESEIRRLARQPERWVRVSDELLELLRRARDVASASNGAFDPTVGPLVELWRTARRERQLPASASFDSVCALVGWRMLEIDVSRKQVRLARRGMTLDLGGIAKGYIVQQALVALRSAGLARAMVEAGGDLAIGDAPPGRSGWHIEIPGASAELSHHARSLTNVVVSTSGPTEQYAVIDGVRYSHVVDPRSGKALTAPTTATVIARDGATADALATAMTVLAQGERHALLTRYSDAVVFIRATDERHEK